MGLVVQELPGIDATAAPIRTSNGRQ